MRGKTRLSKKVPAQLRYMLFRPEVVAKQYNPRAEANYTRLNAKRKPEMSAIVAAMRKRVYLCFSVLHSGKACSVDWKTLERPTAVKTYRQKLSCYRASSVVF